MKMKNIVLALSFAGLLSACDKPDVGFFSFDGIRMQEDTLEVIRGIYQYSNIPMIDGSSRPLYFELVGARNYDTGEEVPDLVSATFPMTLWKTAFNALTDTTMEQVNQKTYLADVVPAMIAETSGIMSFNSATSKFPVGKYGIDVKVTNSKGSKVFKDYCIMKLISKPYTLGTYFRDQMRAGEMDSTYKNIEYIDLYPDEELKLIQEGKNSRRRITRVGDSDIMELEMLVKDCEGTPISPKALKAIWSSAGYYRNTYEVNSLAMEGSSERYIYTDSSAIYRFPTVPYPSFSAEYTGTNAEVYIPMTFYYLDSDYYVLTEETKEMAKEKRISVEKYRFNFANMVTFNETGKWKLEVFVPYILSNGKK